MKDERNRSTLLQYLTTITEEHYAHARDHEHLRAQITSILVAATFLLIGFAIEANVGSKAKVFISAAATVLSVINVLVVLMHNNRFKRHVDMGDDGMAKILGLVEGDDSVSLPETDRKKRGSLAATWVVVAALPMIAGWCIWLI